MEGWPASAVAAGLVLTNFIWLFRMLATGGLVTRREHDAVKQDRDYWRTAATTTAHTAEKLADQKSVGIAAVESIALTAQAGDA